MRATWHGAVIAERADIEVVDGYTYFSIGAVDERYLRASDRHTTCPWKGPASYFDIVVDDQVNESAAWTYPTPSERAAPLVGRRIGFWRGVRIEGRDDDQPGGGPLRRLIARGRR